MVPLNLLNSNHKVVKVVNDPIVLGKVPVNELVLKSINCTDDIDPIVLGMVPVSELKLK